MKNQPVFDISHFETYELQCKSNAFLEVCHVEPYDFLNENAMVLSGFLKLSLRNSNAKSVVFLAFLQLGLTHFIVKAVAFLQFLKLSLMSSNVKPTVLLRLLALNIMNLAIGKQNEK